MNKRRLPKLLLPVALLLGAIGVLFALLQPGDLGGDDAETETAQSDVDGADTDDGGTDTDVDDVTVTDTETVTETDTAT